MNKSDAQKWLDKMHKISDRIIEVNSLVYDSRVEVKRLKREFEIMKNEWINYLVKEAKE